MKKNHKIYFLVAVGLTLISWVIAIIYWDKLPSVIPVHFGISGAADGWADKSLFYVFMLPVLELLMTIMFYFLYFHPQYTNMPSTMWLTTLDEKSRNIAYDAIRKTLIGTLLWVNILFTYLVYGMNVSALDNKFVLSPWLMFGFLAGMLLWLTWWTIKVYHLTKKVVKEIKE